ncbi:Hypothetical predicted protein [Paramuricea clavata]|uniref:Uncharacterized protein n=1 Tax=Paramuricea clavata TaxID=317549 RepID=A0A6S7I3H4_PARCT|nr:Hypothetical predicted protein [Paramuricea clavata]
MVSSDSGAKERRLKVGNQVVVMQKSKNKLTTVFNPTPLTVTNIKGSMITANKNEWSITRDASTFRKLFGRLPPRSSKKDGEEIYEAENDTNEQSDQEEHEEDEEFNEGDIEQDKERSKR